ncbi:MAG: 50S ribosomal protein L33 [Elusimicrobiota bacterium]
MREPVNMECTVCKERNYSLMKDKKKKQGKMEIKKFCNSCRKHTKHKELK